jgi:prepilin-type N-terminal cleavage/methylation domain-containing protein/prepilin-type processing-associated H-X9-DG protein
MQLIFKNVERRWTPLKVRRSFSLIELLAVIAIIAILMSMLFPSLARSREMAKRAACMSNQHQVSVGLVTFAAENERKFPATQATPRPGIGVWTVYQPPRGDKYGLGKLFFESYIDDAQVFYCPSWDCPRSSGAANWARYDVKSSSGNAGGFPAPSGTFPSNVVFVNYFLRGSFAAGSGLWRPASLSRDKAHKAILADFWTNTAASTPGIGRFNHWGEGYNTLYMDGHARWLADPNMTVAGASVDFVRNYRGGNSQNKWWTRFFNQ